MSNIHRSRSKKSPRTLKPRRLASERLEDRSLLSVGPSALFGSVGPSTLIGTKTTLVGSPAASLQGTSVTFTATVTPTTTTDASLTGGTVDFYDGTTKIGTGTLNSSGVATFATTAEAPLPEGIDRIFADYQGNSTFKASSSKGFLETVRTDFLTLATLKVTGASVYGQSTTLTATVKAVNPRAGVPIGKISFYDNAADLATATPLATVAVDSDGVATFALSSPLAVGRHVFLASYSPTADSGYDASTSARQVVTTAKAATSVSLVGSQLEGAEVAFTATVTSPNSPTAVPTGSVSFYDGNTLLQTVALTDGYAHYSTTTLIAGTHHIRAVYRPATTPATDFFGSAATITQVVTAPTQS